MKCPVCNKPIEIEMVPFSDQGIYLGEFEAEVCHKDNEIFFTEQSARLIEKTEKKAGIWGSELPVKNQKRNPIR